MKSLVFCVLLSSQIVFAQASKYAGSFLEIPVGARAMGMGNAFVSVGDDGTAFHYNPAGAALTDNQVLSMMYSSQYGSLLAPLSSFYFIGFAQKLQDLNISIDWIRLGVEDIPLEPDLTVYDSPAQRELLVKTGSDNGYFNSADDAVYLDISRMFSFEIDVSWAISRLPVKLPVGINFKIIHRSLNGRAASGVGIDGGLMLMFPLGSYFGRENNGRFCFGVNLRDVTDTRIAWDTQTTEVIPRSTLWGVSYGIPLKPIEGDLLIAFNRDTKYGDMLVGAEYAYRNLLSIRLGSDASNLTAGAGILLDFMRVDYAFLAHDLGNVHRVSAAFYIDKIFK